MGGVYGGNDTSGDTAYATAYYQNQQAQRNINAVNQAFAQFTPDWYQQKANAYTASALPELNRQVGKESEAITYALANRGLQNSTAGQNLFQQLGENTTSQKQQLANAGQNYAQNLQRQINQSKLALYSLGGTPGAGSAAGSAIQTAAGFQTPNPIAPITDYLSNFNNQLAMRFALSSPTGRTMGTSIAPANIEPNAVGGGGTMNSWSQVPSTAYTVN